MTNTTSTPTTSTTSTSADRAGSLIVAAVEQTWAAIQHRHREVPGVVVTFGAGTIGTAPGTVRLGHFAPARWATDAAATETPVHKLFIGGEGLARGPVNLLHEAAHALAHARGIQDTSRQGRYHNTRYKAVAEELGITVAQVGAIGWSDTTVPTTTSESYAAEVADLGQAIRAYRRAEGGREARKRRNGVALLCGCQPVARRIRLALSVAETGPITCGVCGHDFTDPDASTDHTDDFDDTGDNEQDEEA